MAKELSYWARWVSGVEWAMNGVEWLLYSAYRIIRWPIVGLWGLGRSALQWAGLIAPPEPAAAPPTHLTIDLRGRWYTGTSILGRIKLFRRFHHWLLAWYTLNPKRLTRWYGAEHKFSEVTFLGAMGRETADDLYDRMTRAYKHFHSNYYLDSDEDNRDKVPSLEALCQVHFEGDYDESDVIGLLQSIYAYWLDKFPFDVQFPGRGQALAHSRWYTVPKATRVQVIEYFQQMRLHGLMLNEFKFLIWRFGLDLDLSSICSQYIDYMGPGDSGSMCPEDVKILRAQFSNVESYVKAFFAARDKLAAYRSSFEESYGGIRLGSMKYLEKQLFSEQMEKVITQLRGQLRSISQEERGRRSLEGLESELVWQGVPAKGLAHHLSWMVKDVRKRGESHLLEDLSEAAERHVQIQQSTEQAIRYEQESDDYERTHEGFWGFCQDVFGLVRLRPKAPDGISPDEIREQVVDGFDEARADGAEEGAPVSGPADDVVTDVFVEGPPAQPPAELPVSSEDADSTQQPAHSATSG